uniref:NADAR domain-containing protein n=1 Tax=Romanomermis culicivorax TaxID=13658 RepID=A0A915IGK7_ROMCU
MEAGRAPWSKPTESEVPTGTDDLNGNRPQGSGRQDLSDKSRISNTRSWPEIIADDENSEKFDQPRKGNLDRNSNSACIDLEEYPATTITIRQERLKMNEITAYLNFNDYKFLQTRSTLEIIREYVKENPAKQAKWIGEKVSWDEKKLGTWPKFAYNQLFKANTLKYEQNKYLREALFETSPAILVEASPYDKNCGVGLAKDHPDIKDPSKWQGQNWFGNLLTKLRNEMMAYYVEETTSNVSSTVVKKRPLDNPSPQQQPLTTTTTKT